eukprot:scaffold8331_cov158-Skeletonema_marinoi.AAC.1
MGVKWHFLDGSPAWRNFVADLGVAESDHLIFKTAEFSSEEVRDLRYVTQNFNSRLLRVLVLIQCMKATGTQKDKQAAA